MEKEEDFLFVRNILMEVWDPIGVSGVEQASDEYDQYASTIVNEQNRFQNIQDISQFLIDVTEKNMGLRGDPDRCQKAAHAVWDGLGLNVDLQ